METQSEILSICYINKSVNGVLRAASWQEGEYFRISIPSLCLSAYGSDLKNASVMLNERVIGSVFSNYLKCGPDFTGTEFSQLGWKPIQLQTVGVPVNSDAGNLVCKFDRLIFENTPADRNSFSITTLLVSFKA